MSQNKTFCPNCGSTEIEQHEASGASICVSCGVVVEENAIVSSVEFSEGAGGTSSLIGQFVGPNGSKPFSRERLQRGGGYGFSRDSRETTLANGRRRIQDVASRMRLPNYFVDAAHRFFTVAVEKNFVQGRRTTHVVAACLYIACRQQQSQHMLIDFSDALQVNVYTLGTCFLKFRRLLGLKLKIVDPALYIYRFAAHLDLDEKANAVALTALRLVGRMKRDWIVAGRRPAGICAAALLIAARAHGFTKHHQDVTKILRVCGMTVHQRLKDFENTPSANLTLDQFISIDLETEADPPRYTSNRIREARAKAIQDNNVELLLSGKLDDPRDGEKSASKWRQSKNVTEKQKELDILYNQLAKDMGGGDDDIDGGEKGLEDDDLNARTDDVHSPSQQLLLQKDETAKTVHVEKANNGNALALTLPEKQGVLANIQYPVGNNGKALVLPNQATAEELQKSRFPEQAKLNLDEWKETMPAFCMEEIDNLFRDDEEVKQKEAIFNKMNKDYLEKMERKESERIAAETLLKEKELDDAAQAEEHARFITSKSQRQLGKRRRDDKTVSFEDDGPTTEEALLATISSRKISRKINYDAMSALFDDTGTFSTDMLEDNEPEVVYDFEVV
jgi:Transcription initiation factor TFIIIB, Brf1 subunit/Transcription initiation factor TFIIB